jgi:hypothetical protein
MNKIDMAELNEMVQAGLTAIGIVILTVGLLYFGYAMGY